MPRTGGAGLGGRAPLRRRVQADRLTRCCGVSNDGIAAGAGGAVPISAATLDAAITESVERPEHEGPTVGHIGLAVALSGE